MNCPYNSPYGFKLMLNHYTDIEIKVGDWSSFASHYNPKFIPVLLRKPYAPPHGGFYCVHNFNLPGCDLFVAPYNSDLPYREWAWLDAESDKNWTIVRRWSTDTGASSTSVINEWVNNKKSTGDEEAWDASDDEEKQSSSTRLLADTGADFESF